MQKPGLSTIKFQKAPNPIKKTRNLKKKAHFLFLLFIYTYLIYYIYFFILKKFMNNSQEIKIKLNNIKQKINKLQKQ